MNQSPLVRKLDTCTPTECEPLAHLSAKVAVVIKAQERHDYKLDQIACTQEAILDTLVAILRTGAI